MTQSLQIEDNDCGVQALITSLHLLGHDVSVPALRDALAMRGARSMRDLRDASAAVCGVRYRGKRDCPFTALTTGAIVHLRADHFVTVERRRGGVEIAVRDRGPGIARRAQARIFRPFERAGDRLSEATEGSGIGLSLVAHVARSHGGSARVESSPGAGASFILWLPEGEVR